MCVAVMWDVDVRAYVISWCGAPAESLRDRTFASVRVERARVLSCMWAHLYYYDRRCLGKRKRREVK